MPQTSDEDSPAADITIVGLGPGDRARRTVAVQEALDRAVQLFLRTAHHPGIEDLVSRQDVTICDQVVGRHSGDWSEAVDAICAAASVQPVVLAVPGHPRYGERIAIQTIAEAERCGLVVSVLDGLSVLDLAATALDSDPMVDDWQVIDARKLVDAIGDGAFSAGMFPFTPLRPMLFSRIHDATVTRRLSRVLLRVFPGCHPITVLQAAGIVGQESISQTTVAELAERDPGPLTSLMVPALGELDAHRDPRTLQHIVARLRAPGGCPWDRKQTNQSLRDSLIDEMYEAVDAIDANDMDNLAEELGDLVLIVMMHAQIAEEEGHFTLEDVYEGITAKIIRRHPHVFGEAEAREAEEVVGLWQRVKAEEKASGRIATSEKSPDGQPRSMPTLTRATRALRKHPFDPVKADSDDPGERLLAELASIIADGEDPDVVLRQTLERHVRRSG